MKIALATTQTLQGSTMIGRLLPLCHQLANHNQGHHQIHILALGPFSETTDGALHFHDVGREPFMRLATGKKRLRGWPLIKRLMGVAWTTAKKLQQLNPDIVIIVKPLPHNVAGVWLWYYRSPGKKKIILDADDFELTANHVTSFFQRAILHSTERTALRLANQVVVASPFLVDRYQQLIGDKGVPPSTSNFGRLTDRISLIPTGLGPLPFNLPRSSPSWPPRLVYVGSLSISSGHRIDLLPEIISQVRSRSPKIKLLMAGHGDDEATLRERFTQLGVSDAVEWYGRFNLHDLPKIITPGTIILDPIDNSLTQRAKSSFRVTLAANLGLPVVTSNIGIRSFFLPRALHDRLFAPPSEAQAYAKLVLDLLEHPLSLTEQEQLQHHATTYQWPVLAKYYQSILAIR